MVVQVLLGQRQVLDRPGELAAPEFEEFVDPDPTHDDEHPRRRTIRDPVSASEILPGTFPPPALSNGGPGRSRRGPIRGPLVDPVSPLGISIVQGVPGRLPEAAGAVPIQAASLLETYWTSMSTV